MEFRIQVELDKQNQQWELRRAKSKQLHKTGT